MTNKLVVIINSLKVQKIRKKITIRNEISCTKLQLPPEPLTRRLLPPDPCSVLFPQLNLLNPPEQNSWVRHFRTLLLFIILFIMFHFLPAWLTLIPQSRK